MSTYHATLPGSDGGLRDPFAGIADLPFLHHDARPLCATADPEDWFRERAGSYADRPFNICRQCPIVMDCLNWAIDNDERWGIWGGTSPEDRRDIRKGKKPRQPRPLRTPLVGECKDCRRTIEIRGKGRCNRCYIRDLRARRAA
jgi:hypothetical protein